jgi:F-type H+-transporting ATPase subunit a
VTTAIRNMSIRGKVFLGLGSLLLLMIALYAIFGSEGRNNEFQPQNEFKLVPWISLKLGPIDMSINKAVLYLFLACALTTATMIYIAKRMEARPNNVQTAVETLFTFARERIVGEGIESQQLALKWFPFIAAVFFFILFSNLIGYIPLPINSEEPVHILGLKVPAFAIYAATANLSVPLVLTLIVWFSYHVEGIRAKGFFGYLKSWIPSGVTGFARYPLFVIEVISHLVRLISLSVRLFANLLAGHLLILFMAGGLVVILGIAAIGVLTLPIAILFFLFEVVLIAGLQAFIFSVLTAIYIGEATAESH